MTSDVANFRAMILDDILPRRILDSSLSHIYDGGLTAEATEAAS